MENFDFQITYILKNIFPHNAFFDGFFRFFSYVGKAAFVWMLFGILLVLFEYKKHKIMLLKLAIITFCSWILSDLVLKYLFMRTRPLPLSPFCPSDFSFPSTHVVTAFTAATVLSYHDKKRTPFYYIFALIISYSRIYLVCHYLFDVFAGAVIGLLFAFITLRIFKKKDIHLR